MRKGFTLIEVMVVIVILGILAAVAIPKLFGNVAKAKASEIPAAASTYIDVQDAYLGANAILGNWSQIGYDAPGSGATENFCYSQGNIADTMSVSRIEGGIIGWGVTNKVALNDCSINSWWSIVITPRNGSSVNYTQNVSTDGCAPLVHNWSKGTTLTGACESPAVNQQNPAQQPAPETPKSETSTTPDSPSETPQPSTPAEEKPESPQTPPSKEVNLEDYYTYTNGEYQKCNSSGNNSWLNGNKNGSKCKSLRDLLVANGDVVHSENKKNEYEFKDEQTRCLVTKKCTNDAYTEALNAKRAEEEAKKSQ